MLTESMQSVAFHGSVNQAEDPIAATGIYPEPLVGLVYQYSVLHKELWTINQLAGISLAESCSAVFGRN